MHFQEPIGVFHEIRMDFCPFSKNPVHFWSFPLFLSRDKKRTEARISRRPAVFRENMGLVGVPCLAGAETWFESWFLSDFRISLGHWLIALVNNLVLSSKHFI